MWMRRLLAYFAVLAPLLWLGQPVTALAQAKPQASAPQTAAIQKSQTPLATGLVGSETCAMCHADVAKKFTDNPHSKLALQHGGQGATCESCHGPGQAHVEGGGDVSKIIRPSQLSPKQLDATCLGCHAGAHPNFLRSPHAKADVSCIGCHSVHSAAPETTLLIKSQPVLCYQCHTDIKPAFAQPFHHKVDEGLVKCSDCHDVHGTFGNNNIKSTADQNAVCTKCHTETRGPFVFEHATVKGEGCLGCHTPHGSQNARLLNVPNINQMCNQCHSPVSAATVHGMNAGSADAIPCISCHTMIHGSNINPAFLR
jgi:DmsE family decaheme c-type cytochrome